MKCSLAGADTGILKGGGSDMKTNKGEGAGGGCAPSRAKRGSFWGSVTQTV